MSLWPVTDHDAREWIVDLYRARLDGRSTAEAVRAADLAVLEARRKAKVSTHPFFWGAFVAAGDAN
jgi:CHAT domain-containing protein